MSTCEMVFDCDCESCARDQRLHCQRRTTMTGYRSSPDSASDSKRLAGGTREPSEKAEAGLAWQDEDGDVRCPDVVAEPGQPSGDSA